MRFPRIVFSLLVASVFVSPLTASVVTVVNDDLRSVEGLLVENTVYDVSFMTGSFNDVFFSSNPPPEFWGNPTAAQTAVSNIGAALTAYESVNDPILSIIGFSDPDMIGIAVPDMDTLGIEVQVVYKDPPRGPYRTGRKFFSAGLDVTQEGLVWAKFTQVQVVPEPGTLAVWSLLGLVAIGVGLSRRFVSRR